jgi:hypothetical protein
MDVRPLVAPIVFEVQVNDDPVEHGYDWHVRSPAFVSQSARMIAYPGAICNGLKRQRQK